MRDAVCGRTGDFRPRGVYAGEGKFGGVLGGRRHGEWLWSHDFLHEKVKSGSKKWKRVLTGDDVRPGLRCVGFKIYSYVERGSHLLMTSSFIAFPHMWSPFFRVRGRLLVIHSPRGPLPSEKHGLVAMGSDGHTRPGTPARRLAPSFLLGRRCPQSGRISLRHGLSYLDQKQNPDRLVSLTAASSPSSPLLLPRPRIAPSGRSRTPCP